MKEAAEDLRKRQARVTENKELLLASRRKHDLVTGQAALLKEATAQSAEFNVHRAHRQGWFELFCVFLNFVCVFVCAFSDLFVICCLFFVFFLVFLRFLKLFVCFEVLG